MAKGSEVSTIRLICPNCGARYDVPANVIPEDGRDVQCSNCSHTWFQPPETKRAAPPPQPEPAPPPPQPGPKARDDDDDGRVGLADLEDRDVVAQRPPVSRQAADVFREEREHEARRRAEDSALESQPGLGLEEPGADGQARRARERMARLRADDVPGDAPQPARAQGGSRRDLLPDVDEITQSLRGGAYLRPAETAPPPPKRTRPRNSGFPRGFLLSVVLGGAAIAAYAYAPLIVDFVPELEMPMALYVAYLDTARVWLDDQTSVLLTMLDGLSSEAPPSGS